MSETTPKICRDCVHSTSVGYLVCRKHVDLVTGDASDCRMVRGNDNLCGPDGKWFSDAATLEARRIMDTIEKPRATIRKESERPWEKGDYTKRDTQ